MSDANDLSGQWAGIFNYPDATGAVAFSADLSDRAGQLSGTITERDTISDGRILSARIDGSRNGDAVGFTKFYEDADPESYDAVAYHGTVTADGREISGDWEIPGIWSGTFIMTRPAAAAADVAIALAETVR